MKKTRYCFEYLLMRTLWASFAILPISLASNLGALLGVILARVPFLAHRAEKNLKLAMPEITQSELDRIILGVWKNMGRTLMEIPHLDKFVITNNVPAQGEIQVVGAEKLAKYQDNGYGSLLFGGHFANWELMHLVTAKIGRPMHVVYRAANNPLIDSWLRKVRVSSSLGALPKGSMAARGILKALREGDPVGMLVDQKMNDGIAIPFFGRVAMTAPALAQLALRQSLPILPVRCERLRGAAFRITFLDALDFRKTDNDIQDVYSLMKLVNNLLEEWIRARPEQWLWLHNRWPDD